MRIIHYDMTTLIIKAVFPKSAFFKLNVNIIIIVGHNLNLSCIIPNTIASLFIHNRILKNKGESGQSSCSCKHAAPN